MARVLCVGVGHVGLPLSLKLWAAGHDVTPVDIDERKILSLRRGVMPFREDGCDRLLTRAGDDARFVPLTYDDPLFPHRVSCAEYVVLTLGTPLGGDYTFRFDQYFDVLSRITPLLARGVTLIVRSTVAPLFTRNVVAARIGAERDWVPGVDFFPSFCPERLMQGTALQDIDDLPEIIGADDSRTADRAAGLFMSLGSHKSCLYVSTVEAELAKLFLNTFRYTMFGLANEFALAAEQYDADMFAVLNAANAGYPRGGIPRPGPSRGPCLGKDTAALAFSSPSSLIAHAALKTNENVVLHVVNDLRSALGNFAHKRVTVLGLAFKADTDDIRDNLTAPLINLLDREGATTAVYDPLVPGYDDPAVLRGSDAVVLMTAHSDLRRWDQELLLLHCGQNRESVFVFDLWNVWPWADWIFGKGNKGQDEDPGDRRVRLADARGRAPAH
ncbi:MAG TPA: nucleotide sugar dehydrogenase [Chloroflexota bacterium]|nr:nucleotide sugar dehydrogenase [Chloroflexota bacterium]